MTKSKLVAMAAFLALVSGCTFSPRYDETYEKCHPGGVCPDGCSCLGDDICIPDDNKQDPAVCKWCEDLETNCNGKCVDTDTDTANCGGCGKPCFFTHAGSVCEEGTCGMTACESGFADCNTNDGDGCEIKLGTLVNCAGCGDACNDFPQPKCNTDGTLTLFAGTARCDGGCVYETRTDDCGALGCLNGHCLKDICPDSSLCAPGEWCNAENICLCGRPGEACDGACCDGVCTNLQADPQNCGACGTTCVPDASCHGGACSISGFLCNGICDIAGAACCDLGNGYVCTTDYCTGQDTTYCNDPGDCNSDETCCLQSVNGNGTSYFGECQMSCPIEHTMCSSDSQCAEIEPTYSCCQKTIDNAGSIYTFDHCCLD